MQSTVVLVLVSAALVQQSASLKLPSWITACYRDDPEFDACAMKNGQASMKRLVQGDRRLQLPVLEPIAITRIETDSGANSLGLSITLTDILIHGLSETNITKIHFDFEKRHISYVLTIPRLTVITTYDVSGKILVLPITGHGPGNITLHGTTIVYDVDYDLVKKNGKDYIMLKNDKMSFDMLGAFIRLENLFNGNKLLGTQQTQKYGSSLERQWSTSRLLFGYRLLDRQ